MFVLQQGKAFSEVWKTELNVRGRQIDSTKLNPEPLRFTCCRQLFGENESNVFHDTNVIQTTEKRGWDTCSVDRYPASMWYAP